MAEALIRRGWQLDEDGEGATLRQPPGTTATDVAFEVLAVLTVAGAPTTPRAATGVRRRRRRARPAAARLTSRRIPTMSEQGSSRVAVVTGAARGMGAATARRLAERGFTVALIDLPLEPEGRVAELPGPYQPAHSSDLDVAAAACEGRGEAHAADVRDVEALGRVIDAVVDRHGRIDVAVAAAGAIAGGTPTWETSDEVWQAMIDVNLTGVFNLARAVVPHLLDAPLPRNGAGSWPSPRPPPTTACPSWPPTPPPSTAWPAW